MKGETDGSSYPNGGLRATHTAGGYLSVDAGDVVQVQSGRQYLKLKLSDLENYRGERGRRGNRLPKGFQKVSGLAIADG